MEDESSASSWRKFARIRPDKRVLSRRAKRIEAVSTKHARTFILDRLENIKSVRRHAFGWLTLVGLLIIVCAFQLMVYQKSYSSVAPTEGGAYAEGVLGPLDTLNPLYATSSAEKSAVRLIFSGLLSYDTTSHLRGELAESWSRSQDALRYEVTLRKNLKWHDGKPLTADDVIFTVNLMKNPLARSSFYNSWSLVKAEKVSDRTIAFNLTRPYAAFPNALTFSILPKHILEEVSPNGLRDAEFSRSPVGSGPFIFNRLQVISAENERSIVYLDKNPQYVRGEPKLDRFQLHVFKTSSDISRVFLSQEITAATDLTSDEIEQLRQRRSANSKVTNTPVDDGVYAFMQTESPLLSDKKVRSALRFATDRQAIINALHGRGIGLETPLTKDKLGDLATHKQPNPNRDEAAKLLEEAGWKLQNGKRFKDGAPLILKLVGAKTGDYPKIVTELEKQWSELGVDVQVQMVEADKVQQTVIVPRDYDVLVYELELGADPDVYAFWHRSQAGPRGLNLSNYRSSLASDALEGAQVRSEKDIRMPKYVTFTNIWLEDIPAIALYQPLIQYVASSTAFTMRSSATFADRTERYRTVELWTVDQRYVYTSPQQ